MSILDYFKADPNVPPGEIHVKYTTVAETVDAILKEHFTDLRAHRVDRHPTRPLYGLFVRMVNPTTELRVWCKRA